MKQNRIITIEIIISIFLLICTLTHITHYKYITAALIVLITTITSKLIKNNTTQKPNTKKIVLAHLSETNNLEDLAIKTVSDLIDNRVLVVAARQDEDMKVLI